MAWALITLAHPPRAYAFFVDRGQRVFLGLLAVPVAPLLMWGMWSLMPAGWLWPTSFFLPFVVVLILGGILWRLPEWKSVGMGLVTGVLLYAVFVVAFAGVAMQEPS